MLEIKFQDIDTCQKSESHVASVLSMRVCALIVHHNSNIAPGRRDRPQRRLTEAAVKDEDDEMKYGNP